MCCPKERSYKISHVHDVWRDYNSRSQWPVGEAKLKCVLKLVSIPCWYFIPSFCCNASHRLYYFVQVYAFVNRSCIHREIMPLSITVAYDILCHGGICYSGESRMSGPLYTVATEISNTLCQMIWSSATVGNVSFVTLLHIEGACSDRVIRNFI